MKFLVSDNFRNEIIWRRSTSHSDAKRFGQVHDTIFWFSKGPNYFWSPQFRPYSPEYVARYFRFEEPDGRRYWKEDATGAGSGPSRKFGDQFLPRQRADIGDGPRKQSMIIGNVGFSFLPAPENQSSSDIWTNRKVSP